MTRVLNDYWLSEKKEVTLPGAIVQLPTLLDKDEMDIKEFAIKQGIDIVSVSFCRKADDIQVVRDLLNSGIEEVVKPIKVFAKIENQEGLNNFEEILLASDGVIINRTKLGMEIAPEKALIAQKWMVQTANLHAKPVVCMS